jgi:glycosyltransferase involved in cell wall biosynthesis
VTVVPHFVDAAAVEPAAGAGAHALYAGRLEGYKGVHTLLEAAAEVPELPLLVAGDGPARAELERRVAAGGLGHVRLLGHRPSDELAALVRASRVVVMPSRSYETFGLSALEAMAAGRAVIASRIGALPELVEDGVTGRLVPPGAAGALAEALRAAAADPRGFEQLGRAGRARALERYTPDEHHQRLLAVYREVL